YLSTPSLSAQDYEPVLAELTTQVWQLTQATTLERIMILEQAVAALQAGTLDDSLHQQALTNAHKLIGSLGTLNFDHGSHIARHIEHLLNQARSPLLVPSLTQALTALRTEISTPAPAIAPGSSRSDPGDAPIPEALPSPHKPQILILDDDPQILLIVKTLLAVHNVQVTGLTDPAQIWQSLDSVQPDLLILDIQMPGMDGLQVCQAVREHPQWQWLPIMFLTVQTDRQTMQQGFAVGADDYLSKPIVPEEFWTRVHNRLKRTQVLRHSS
ncbi:MAG TPA: response regulator, partial [Allocoleopsis sp.]